MGSTVSGRDRVLALLGAFVGTSLLALPAAWAVDPDIDGDGVFDAIDNCPSIFNPLQVDCNDDGVGDACNTLGASGSDADGDGVCDALDNCAAVPNTMQGDCDLDGIGDLCEASIAERDDDGDGICNGGDACPREAAVKCSMQALSVPFNPANLSSPHPTFSGATHTLKGMARYGGDQYAWDFGDGSAAMAWTAIANPYNLAVTHVYSGMVGQLFVATLSVRSSLSPGVVATATYPVQIEDSGALPANHQMDPARMDVLVDMALDQALWYLHTTMNRGTYANSAPGFGQPFGTWTVILQSNCRAVTAFLERGRRPNADYAKDPYVETTQRVLNYILVNASSAAIAPVAHNGVTDRPDYNGNGIGVRIGPDDLRTNGVCALALAASASPERQSIVGADPYVFGRTYKAIAQDTAEWFAHAQSDSGFYEGGWQYTANSNSADTRENPWPMLAIAAAEKNMRILTPRFVRTEAPYFMYGVRHTALDNRNGGWGYQSPNDSYVNHQSTASGILFHFFVHDSATHPNVQAALGFLYRYWSLQNYDTGGQWNVGLGNSNAMVAVAQAMRATTPSITRVVEYDYNNALQTANGFDWYYTPLGQTQQGLATDLVLRQAANGSWADTQGFDAMSGFDATASGVLILSKGPMSTTPAAVICDCTGTYGLNQDVTLDASCSSHLDPRRSIVTYEWDFAYGGSSFNATAAGRVGTLAGGYPTYGSHPVALRVIDDNPVALGGPRSALALCSVVTKVPPNCPHARAGGPYVGSRNVAVMFDASASFDPDADPLSFAWDFDHDGLYGANDYDVFGLSSDGVGPNPAFAFAALGTYAVALEVTDDPALNAVPYAAPPCARIASATVEIRNLPPVARPGGPYRTPPGAAVALDGTGSSDPDGDALSYAWDLDHNGVFGDAVTSQPSIAIASNATPCTASIVCLKVTDAPGSVSDGVCTTVSVIDAAPPSLTCPLDVAVECNARHQATAVDAGAATGSDSCGVVPAVDPPVANYALGASVVTHTATGETGLSSTCTHTIRVVDTTRPVFDPASLDARALTGNCAGTPVELTPPTASDTCGDVVVTCAPVLGTSVGANTVSCAATDEAGNTVMTDLTVTVSAASGCGGQGDGDGAPVVVDGGGDPVPAARGCGCSTTAGQASASGVAWAFVLALAGAGLAWRRRRNRLHGSLRGATQEGYEARDAKSA